MNARALTLALALAGLAAVGCTSTSGARAPTSPARSVHNQTADSSLSVRFEGISYTLPDGWTVAQPHCGSPADHTVVLGTYRGSCPAGLDRGAAPTAVTMTTLYGRQYALSWPGRRTTWHGQPAWLDRHQTQGRSTVMLSLPWLNAVVTAQSAGAAEARALLDRVKPNARGDLDVPRTAPSVFIQSLAGHDGDGQKRSARITDAAAIQLILRDLGHLSTVRDPVRACDSSWWPSTAVITLPEKGASRTYAARFDDCGLVIAGTGVAGTVTSQLLSDVRRLVPESGL